MNSTDKDYYTLLESVGAEYEELWEEFCKDTNNGDLLGALDSTQASVERAIIFASFIAGACLMSVKLRGKL